MPLARSRAHRSKRGKEMDSIVSRKWYSEPYVAYSVTMKE